MLFHNIAEMIGKTPLLEAHNFAATYADGAHLLCKLECFNPAGSAKDRVALAMLNDAEERGLIKAGATIIEPTSGNTGIGLAALCARRGYRLILTMPDSMSAERRALLAAYGAEIVLTDGTPLQAPKFGRIAMAKLMPLWQVLERAERSRALVATSKGKTRIAALLRLNPKPRPCFPKDMQARTACRESVRILCPKISTKPSITRLLPLPTRTLIAPHNALLPLREYWLALPRARRSTPPQSLPRKYPKTRA